MGWFSEQLYLLSILAGCSFLYNPDRLAAVDAAPDARIDANPLNLTLMAVESPALLEGQGDTGSRALGCRCCDADRGTPEERRRTEGGEARL